jgi:hypothetical protein
VSSPSSAARSARWSFCLAPSLPISQALSRPPRRPVRLELKDRLGGEGSVGTVVK